MEPQTYPVQNHPDGHGAHTPPVSTYPLPQATASHVRLPVYSLWESTCWARGFTGGGLAV